MKLPLLVLAFLSIVAGFLGIEHFIAGEHGGHHAMNYLVAGISVATAVAGMALGTMIYRGQKSSKDPLKEALGGVYKFIVHKYYLDDIFQAIADAVRGALAQVLLWFDLNVIIEKGANGSAALTRAAGSLLRRAQTGRVQSYAMAFGFGVVLIVYWVVIR